MKESSCSFGILAFAAARRHSPKILKELPSCPLSLTTGLMTSSMMLSPFGFVLESSKEEFFHVVRALSGSASPHAQNTSTNCDEQQPLVWLPRPVSVCQRRVIWCGELAAPKVKAAKP